MQGVLEARIYPCSVLEAWIYLCNAPNEFGVPKMKVFWRLEFIRAVCWKPGFIREKSVKRNAPNEFGFPFIICLYIFNLLLLTLYNFLVSLVL